MGFSLGATSRKRLEGVHLHLVGVVQSAIALATLDFGVSEGLRTRERQAELFAQGKTKTLDSRHLTGHAIDVVALVNGQASWALANYITIAEAMRGASVNLSIPIRWGGCWEVLTDVTDLAAAVTAYVARVSKAGGKPLVDGPHFELPRTHYPA